MSLSGLGYAFFFPLVWLVHWLLPRRAWAQNSFLLAMSYLFYATWNVRLLPVLVGATLIDYVVGLQLDREEASERSRRIWFGLGVAANLGALAWFKYVGFFAESLNGLLATLELDVSLTVLRVALPLGISYYTLIKLGTLIDVYYRRVPACRSLLTFATYVSFFPQLIAGPIGRAHELLPQYQVARRLDPARLGSGASTFLLGFAMKAYVADWLAIAYVTPIFADHLSYGVLGHWVGLLAYAAQLFCDFAGYSLLAIGSGRMLGIELPRNFDYPFFSRGMLEFWRRWHISLNAWLFDYLFSPMTTGRGFMRGKISLAFLITFLISGLWHGARWTFVAWGLLHGVALVVQFRWDVFYKSLCRKDRVWVARRKSFGYQTMGWALTQAFFLFTLIAFRAGSLAEAVAYAGALVQSPGSQVPPLASVNLLLCIAFLVGYHGIALPVLSPLRDRLAALPAPVRGVAYGLAVLILGVFIPVGAGTFIYAQF